MLAGLPSQSPSVTALPKGEPLAYRKIFASPFGSNNDDRRQWRKQRSIVGAAASKTQAKRCGCWVPQPGRWMRPAGADGEGKDAERRLTLC